jgi:alkanesulfonate monooxygenase SsuD/methylene tetrahydromethanopterin reductase-like flavin-dependent oxidoreductase (luciferase family)
VIGDPETVERGLAALAARTGADELMVSTRAHSFASRARSLTLLAERWGMVPAAA